MKQGQGFIGRPCSLHPAEPYIAAGHSSVSPNADLSPGVAGVDVGFFLAETIYPPNTPEYWPGVIEVKDVERLPNGGPRMAMVYKMAGVRFDIGSECTEWVPNQRTVYESEGGVSSTITWIYEPHDGGAKVTVESEYTVQLPVLRKLADSFLTRMNENEAEVVLANVKAKMEA